MRDYSADDYRRMLVNVLDANYGMGFHDIGSDDGLPPEEADEIIEFWRGHLHEHVEQVRATLRAVTPATKEREG